MTLIVVDVESDGPAPGLYSMVSIGAVVVDATLKKTFYGEFAPISEQWIEGALAVSKISREQHLAYPNPQDTTKLFYDWVKANSDGRSILISDNNGFDAAYVNYYMHKYMGENPFGFSSRRIGDFYAGLTKDFFGANKWKHMRKTKHTHDPVDDATGNAEAIITMCQKHGLKMPY